MSDSDEGGTDTVNSIGNGFVRGRRNGVPNGLVGAILLIACAAYGTLAKAEECVPYGQKFPDGSVGAYASENITGKDVIEANRISITVAFLSDL